MNEDNATVKDDSIHSSTTDLKKHSSIESSKFESQKMDSQSNLVGTLLSKIEDQIPPDWKMSLATFQVNGNSSTTSTHKNTNAVPPAIYSKSFKWKKADTF